MRGRTLNGDTVNLGGSARAVVEETCKAAHLQPRMKMLHALVMMILMRLYSFYTNKNEIVTF